MRTTVFQLFCLLTTAVLVVSACNLPSSNATSEIAPQTEQSTANATVTIELTATQTQVVPTETVTVTATETPLPEPSATATIEVPVAEVVRESNCRIGPAGNYDLVATYQPGQMLEIVAKDLGAGYWFVRNSEKPEEQCYLLAQNITISGDTSALPKFTPRPSPTAAPYFNVDFKKIDTCEGEDFALFDVENVGSVPFRSYYIKVTDQKVSKSVEQVLNAFDLRVRCVLAKNIAPLNPGEAGYVYSPQFKWAATGNKLRAVIMLCTEKDLKGTCVTQSLDMNP
ncbi:MAG: hypothetical protein L0287_06015 [Anaerolineae bacterium]|nr:hypothetical protein [Anaerolineae bacterium]MCI0609201.1 hypothetical protein [Anaerolineae bacterium]